MLGGFHSWQNPLCWSGPSHTHSVAGGWKKTWETIKCSLLRGNVSTINMCELKYRIRCYDSMKIEMCDGSPAWNQLSSTESELLIQN